MRSQLGWQEDEVDRLIDVLGAPGRLRRPPMAHQFAAPGASTPARLRLVLRDRGDLALRLLQHGVNLWPDQKPRTQRLILYTLCQLLDHPLTLTLSARRPLPS